MTSVIEAHMISRRKLIFVVYFVGGILVSTHLIKLKNTHDCSFSKQLLMRLLTAIKYVNINETKSKSVFIYEYL